MLNFGLFQNRTLVYRFMQPALVNVIGFHDSTVPIITSGTSCLGMVSSFSVFGKNALDLIEVLCDGQGEHQEDAGFLGVKVVGWNHFQFVEFVTRRDAAVANSARPYQNRTRFNRKRENLFKILLFKTGNSASAGAGEDNSFIAGGH